MNIAESLWGMNTAWNIVDSLKGDSPSDVLSSLYEDIQVATIGHYINHFYFDEASIQFVGSVDFTDGPDGWIH